MLNASSGFSSPRNELLEKMTTDFWSVVVAWQTLQGPGCQVRSASTRIAHVKDHDE